MASILTIVEAGKALGLTGQELQNWVSVKESEVRAKEEREREEKQKEREEKQKEREERKVKEEREREEKQKEREERKAKEEREREERKAKEEKEREGRKAKEEREREEKQKEREDRAIDRERRWLLVANELISLCWERLILELERLMGSRGKMEPLDHSSLKKWEEKRDELFDQIQKSQNIIQSIMSKKKFRDDQMKRNLSPMEVDLEEEREPKRSQPRIKGLELQHTTEMASWNGNDSRDESPNESQLDRMRRYVKQREEEIFRQDETRRGGEIPTHKEIEDKEHQVKQELQCSESVTLQNDESLLLRNSKLSSQQNSEELIENTETELTENTEPELIENTETELIENTETELIENTELEFMKDTESEFIEHSESEFIEDTESEFIESSESEFIESSGSEFPEDTELEFIEYTEAELLSLQNSKSLSPNNIASTLHRTEINCTHGFNEWQTPETIVKETMQSGNVLTEKDGKGVERNDAGDSKKKVDKKWLNRNGRHRDQPSNKHLCYKTVRVEVRYKSNKTSRCVKHYRKKRMRKITKSMWGKKKKGRIKIARPKVVRPTDNSDPTDPDPPQPHRPPPPTGGQAATASNEASPKSNVINKIRNTLSRCIGN